VLFEGQSQANASVYACLDVGARDRFKFPPLARHITNKFGFFTFVGLLPGRYVIVARKEGFLSQCSPVVFVRPNDQVPVTLRMLNQVKMLAGDLCLEASPEELPISSI
jgi:hypothetical protein